jgi:hypothetical protein
MPPQLRNARFEDYAQIARLESSNDLETQPEKDWRSVWLDNPLWPRLSDRWPMGWVLEDSAGGIVGSVLNVPSLYNFRGRELICANGRAWCASAEYRGFALMLMDEYFNQEGADLFVNTTVGPMALQILNELSVRVPTGDWESVAYFITGYRGFARKALEKLRVPMSGLFAGPAGMALRLKDAIAGKSFPAAPAGVVIEQAVDFDSRFDDFWRELLRMNSGKLLAVRDRASLAWHFSIPLRRKRLWIVTASRNGRIGAFCIFKRHDQAQGIRRMRLIDFQTIEPESDLLPALLKTAIGRCAAEEIDILDHLGCGLPKMRRFEELTPYRQKLSNWPFYYRATDPALHKELAAAEVWDPSSFDGDASFE